MIDLEKASLAISSGSNHKMTGLIKSFYRHVLLDGVAVQETCPLNDHSRADCNINERQHHAHSSAIEIAKH